MINNLYPNFTNIFINLGSQMCSLKILNSVPKESVLHLCICEYCLGLLGLLTTWRSWLLKPVCIHDNVHKYHIVTLTSSLLLWVEFICKTKKGLNKIDFFKNFSYLSRIYNVLYSTLVLRLAQLLLKLVSGEEVEPTTWNPSNDIMCLVIEGARGFGVEY
jgi:hypothetical protein